MRDTVLNICAGWAVLAVVVVLIGAVRHTIGDIRKSKERKSDVGYYTFLWTLLIVGAYFLGGAARGWL